jgi:hypothetical protein
MASRKTLCKRFKAGESVVGNDLTTGGYLAVAFRAAGELPPPMRRDDHIVRQGYGVGLLNAGHWYFFEDIAPALAFGRAARMSFECNHYGVYQAVHELLFCPVHKGDEQVLHLTGDNLDRREDEVEHLKRFVQGVKEHPWSSSWEPPTGYITAYDNGQPVKTAARSLPL